jgi:heme a synthase
MAKNHAEKTSGGQSAGALAARRNDLQVGWWVLSVAGLIFLMVLVGGITRLTDSGLSITEWKPIMGALPPLSEAAWLDAFEKYKQIPEYALVNAGMSLSEFKFIFFWEWFHRLLGRFIGVAFAVPFVYFLVTRSIRKELVPQLVVLFLLGGAQGALGWFMVMSGLVDRVDVSQYRLTAHLGFAVVLFMFALWVALGLLVPRKSLSNQSSTATSSLVKVTAAFIGLVYIQILLGGFVAGLDAGIGFNTWPMMDGAIIPQGLFEGGPFYISAFEHKMTVQFNHRMVAYAVALFAALLVYVSLKANPSAKQRRILILLAFSVAVQIALGIFTLVFFVPLTLAAFHQGGALVVLGLSVYYLYLLQGSSSPA